jgi:hypothetical protein
MAVSLQPSARVDLSLSCVHIFITHREREKARSFFIHGDELVGMTGFECLPLIIGHKVFF